MKKVNELLNYVRSKNETIANDYSFLATYVVAEQRELDKYYKLNAVNDYPVLNAESISKIKNSYAAMITAIAGFKNVYKKMSTEPNVDARKFDEIINMLKEDQIIVDKLDPKDHLSLPKSVYKLDKEIKKHDYDNGNYKWPGFYEYRQIYNSDKNKTEEEILNEYIKKTPEEVKDYYINAIEKDPKKYEFVNLQRIVPAEIRNTSDVELINDFINKNKNKLTYPQMYKLKKIAEVNTKAKELEEGLKTAFLDSQELGEKPKLVVKKEDDLELIISPTEYQSNTNTCWSVSSLMLVKSRGHNDVNQLDIRGYRPLLTEADRGSVVDNDELDICYNTPQPKNIMDMADGILKFAPNTMLHGVDIELYSKGTEKMGISRETYLNNTVNFMKKRIINALKVDKSPVSLLIPGHYITITGIKGDTIKYKDSIPHGNSVGHTYTMSLKEFVSKEFAKPIGSRLGSIQLTWISDIKLAKDNKTIHGVPSSYVELGEGGKLNMPPERLSSSAMAETRQTNKIGFKVVASCGDEEAELRNDYDVYAKNGVSFVEKVYLPKTVNRLYLTNMAALRSKEEEDQLNDVDNNIYGIAKDRAKRRAELDNIMANGYVKPVVEELVVEEEIENLTLKSIRDNARKLLNELDKNSHFWLFSTKPSYDLLIGKLNEIVTGADNGLRSAVNNDNEFKPEDYANIVKAMDDAIKFSKTYLDLKREEIEADPGRKNAEAKQSNEQPRIKAALDSYELLTKMRAEINKKVYNQPLSAFEKAANKAVIDDYKSTMIANADNPSKLQNDSYKNRINHSDSFKPYIERIDAMWSKEFESIGAFDNPEVFEKGENNRPSYRNIKRINDDFMAIGQKSMSDKLTNKDYAALAFLNSCTMPVYSLMDQDINTNRFSSLSSASIRHHQHAYDTLIRATGLGDEKQMTYHIPYINKSKDVVTQALKSYKVANKEPLAKVIADSITNITYAARKDLLTNDDIMLVAAEMAMRITGILDRDQELYNQAIKAGLKAEDINYIKQMKIVGELSSSSKEFMAKSENGLLDNIPTAKKEESYCNLLLNEMYKETKIRLKDERNINPEFVAKKAEIDDIVLKQYINSKTEVIESIKTAFSSNSLSVKNSKEKKEALKIYDDYQKELKELDKVKNANNKKNKHKEIVDKYAKSVTDYSNRINEYFKAYKSNLLEKHKDALEIINNDRLADNKKKLTESEMVEEALIIENNLTSRYRVADNDEERMKFDKEKYDYDLYTGLRSSFMKFNKNCLNLKHKLNDLEDMKKELTTNLEIKYLKTDPLFDSFTNRANLEKTRKRIRNFVKAKELDKLSPKDFVDKVIKDKSVNSILNGASVDFNLTVYENQNKHPKAELKLNQQEPNADNEIKNNAENKNINKVNINSVKTTDNNKAKLTK
ncbi:MAG: hypothetical protein K5656_08080 [Lachnospiraceae bacterium]|nr:hypothetical protein [Lachnospiraceae bacterium]